MAETLYRKYRPQTFRDLVGQQHVRVTLENAIKTDRVAHAYLLTGPRGTGKTTTARLLARAINCLDRKNGSEPCNACANCQAILAGRTLDIMEIDAASQTGVDNVRENIIQSARAFPSLLPKKVFIIDEVHMLSLAAFNALLKIIEEPPPHAMFILATTDAHRVPETIISRTQRFDFQRLSLEDMAQRLQSLAGLEKRRLGPGVAERIARSAGGSQRDAESLLGQVFSFSDRDITIEQLDAVLPRADHQRVMTCVTALVPGQAAEAMTTFHQFVADGGDVTTFVQDVLELSRHLLLLVVSPQATPAVAQLEDAQTFEQLNQLAKTTTASRVIQVIEAFLVALRQLPQSSIEELPVEVAIASICVTPGPSGPAAPPSASPVPTAPLPPTVPPKKPTGRKQKSLTLETAQAAWTELQGSTGLPPGLALSVKQAQVTAVDAEDLRLSVPYSLHADRLQNHKNIDLILQLAPVLAGLRFDVHIDTDRAVSTISDRQTAMETKSTESTKKVAAGDDLWDTLVSSLSETA